MDTAYWRERERHPSVTRILSSACIRKSDFLVAARTQARVKYLVIPLARPIFVLVLRTGQCKHTGWKVKHTGETEAQWLGKEPDSTCIPRTQNNADGYPSPYHRSTQTTISTCCAIYLASADAEEDTAHVCSTAKLQC
ncbi:hypothetical protein BaRGS_00005876 [Batillaria attramentaria]|uniref:Uncharacterized protein n=1 Tax=Batillaria attramentaria TaxID=370345 RepID=A0ABD0LUF3_9CAEN